MRGFTGHYICSRVLYKQSLSHSRGIFMKTLGCAVVLLLAFAGPLRSAQVYSGCAVPSPTPRHVWYIDPVHGKTPAAGGNGSQASPWNSLPGVIAGQWGASNFS